jgi:hypothetical protein
MKRNKKEEELMAIKSKLAVKKILKELQPTLIKLANPESLKEEEFQKPVVDIRSLTIDQEQHTQGRGYYRTYSYTSKIRLSGNWLLEKGFQPRGRVKVLALNGMLVICPE